MDQNHPDVSFSGKEDRYGDGLTALVKSLRRAFAVLLGIIFLLVLYFVSFGGYFSVEPQQAVLVLRFGKIIDCLTTGGHWYVPYPVHRFVRIRTNRQVLTVELSAADPNGAALTPGRDRYLLTGDANIVHASWHVAYRIDNPVQYYTKLAAPTKLLPDGRIPDDPVEIDSDGFSGARGPQTLLKSIFSEALLKTTASEKVDSILSSGQAAYSDRVFREFAREIAALDCGIEIVGVTLDRIAPPDAAKGAFEEVTAASNTKDALRNEARAYRIQMRNDALAKKAEILADAETYRKQVVSVVRAESAYFDKIQQQYVQSPQTIMMALYTSALADAFSDLDGNRFILGTAGEVRKQLRLRLNPEAKKTVPVKEEKK